MSILKKWERHKFNINTKVHLDLAHGVVMVNSILFTESSFIESLTKVNRVLWVIWVTESGAQREQRMYIFTQT